MSECTFDLAMELCKSDSPFPVFFDEGWEWLAFSRKDNAKRNFESCDFVEGVDYVVLLITEESDNHKDLSPQEKAVLQRTQRIQMTVDCFKSWAMMVGTAKGKEVRKYFLDCEKALKGSFTQIQNLVLSFEARIDNAVNTALASRLEKIDKYEQSCKDHKGTGSVIQSDVEDKKYPSETITVHEYCRRKGIDRTLWLTFSRRYAQFVRVGTKAEPPRHNGKLVIYGEYYYYADAALKSVLDLD
jgi:phage anti-repressor protein